MTFSMSGDHSDRGHPDNRCSRDQGNSFERLAEFKYYNMDHVLLDSMDQVKTILAKGK
jgi:hypothetical protein